MAADAIETISRLRSQSVGTKEKPWGVPDSYRILVHYQWIVFLKGYIVDMSVNVFTWGPWCNIECDTDLWDSGWRKLPICCLFTILLPVTNFPLAADCFTCTMFMSSVKERCWVRGDSCARLSRGRCWCWGGTTIKVNKEIPEIFQSNLLPIFRQPEHKQTQSCANK